GRDTTSFFGKRARHFDLLAGTDELRKQIVAGLTEEQIRHSWQRDLEEYKELRAKYLIYKDYNE
ncbi:MAG: DUF1343 domain-containing protein, partial [Tannerella sp.]|nr:DUF1343 domain-containing protein [Tannerella sp.]